MQTIALTAAFCPPGFTFQPWPKCGMLPTAEPSQIEAQGEMFRCQFGGFATLVPVKSIAFITTFKSAPLFPARKSDGERQTSPPGKNGRKRQTVSVDG